jgi:pimeloyl-ACP methyl ester carboxylesterase
MDPLIDLLTVKGIRAARSKKTAFNIVIPSLPGYGFSSAAPDGWTIQDTARILDRLMHDVLGYKKYAVHGTDWGSPIAYQLYNKYNTTVRALHLNFPPFYSLDFQQLAALNITLAPEEVPAQQRAVDWRSSGNGYFIEQATKVSCLFIGNGILGLMLTACRSQILLGYHFLTIPSANLHG